MHRFDLTADEKDGFLSMLSALALNVLYLITFASSMLLVHEGISPHFKSLILSRSVEHTAGISGRAKAW